MKYKRTIIIAGAVLLAIILIWFSLVLEPETEQESNPNQPAEEQEDNPQLAPLEEESQDEEQMQEIIIEEPPEEADDRGGFTPF